MDPNYWAASLKYPPQSSATRNDSLQPTLSSAGLGANFASFEQLLILERQRLASGFAAGILSQHQQNLLGHAYSAGASTGTYPSNLLEAPGSQSLYAYAGALTQPYSAALSQPYTATVLSQPVFPGSFMSYDAQTSHGSSIESSGITTVSKSVAPAQKRSSGSDYNTLQRPVPVSVARTSAITSSLSSPTKSAYGQQPTAQDKTHRQRDAMDLDSRYNSLSNFMDSTVASQNQTISANQGMSGNQVMSANHSMFLHNVHSPTRRSSDASSNVERSSLSVMRTTPKPNLNPPMTPSYLKSSNVTSQRPDCNQRLTSTMSSGLDMLQFSDVNAVDLTQFSKVIESGHHRKITEQSMSTIDTGDLLLGEYDLNAARRAAGGLSGGRSGQCAEGGGGGQSMQDTGGSGQWLLSPQQYGSTPTVVVAAVRGNQYEAITPPPPSAPHNFDSLYTSTSQASQNFATEFVSAAGYYSNSRSGSGATDSNRLGIGTGSSHKKPGESGVGIVLPMPQTRELSTFDTESFDPLRYGGCINSSGGGGSSQLQANLYHSSNDQAISKLRDAMPLASKQSFSTIAKDGSLSADSSQPIYLANINGNIYVNQYTMLQQPGGGMSDATIGDDYNPLTDFGIAPHSSGVYPTIDQAGYQSIVSDDVGFEKVAGDCHDYKEADAASRSTMLVPSVNDQELGHLTIGLPKTTSSQAPTAAIVASSTSSDILGQRPPQLDLQKPAIPEVPATLSKLKMGGGNAFENSFLKFLKGDKTETLSSVTTSPIRNRPVMPKYIPEAPRRPAPPPPSPPPSEVPVNTERVEQPMRPTKTMTKRKESSDGPTTIDALNPQKTTKLTTTSPVESGDTGVSTVPSPSTTPRKFPAKFSHKMHNRSPSTVVDDGCNVVKLNPPNATSATKQQNNSNIAGVKQTNTTTDTPKSDNKRPHNAAFETSSSSSSSSSSSTKKRSSGSGDATDPNNTQIQWTISKRESKMEINKSSAHIPVLVIKAVPPSGESKEMN